MNKLASSATVKSRLSVDKPARSATVTSRVLVHKKKIITAGLVLLAGVIVAATPEPGVKSPAWVESRPASTLAATETKYDFGSISMAAGKVTHRYRIRNAGADPIQRGLNEGRWNRHRNRALQPLGHGQVLGT